MTSASVIGAEGGGDLAGNEPTVDDALSRLRETPAAIAAITEGLTPAQLRARPEPGEWSATEVLAHLRACADQWGGCMSAMIAEDHPTLRAINPTTWIRSTDYPDLEFRPSLAAYTAQRAELVATLEPLPPGSWARGATVTGAGAPLERTVLFYARWLVRHERPHLKQVARIVAALRA